MGTFLVDATGLVGATYNSNVYAQNNNEESDVIVRIGGEVAGRTNWAVHAVRLRRFCLPERISRPVRRVGADAFMPACAAAWTSPATFSLGARVFADKAVEQRYEPAGLGGLEKPIEYTVAGARSQRRLHQ